MNMHVLWDLLVAAEGDGATESRGLQVLRMFSLSGMHLSALLGLAGFALLVLLLAPDRHARAVRRIAAGPLRAWLLGSAVLLLVSTGLVVLLKAGITPGRTLFAVALVVGLAAGVSVSGRALAARVMEEHGALIQTAVGVVVVVLTLASPFGLVVLGVVGPLGLGALLFARR